MCFIKSQIEEEFRRKGGGGGGGGAEVVMRHNLGGSIAKNLMHENIAAWKYHVW